MTLTTHLMATRLAAPDAEPDSEQVLVDVDADVVRLVLDDGEVVEFDRVELHAAIAPLAA